MTETSENITEIQEFHNKFDAMIWSDEDAILVGNFLSHKNIQTLQGNDDEWKKLAFQTDFNQKEGKDLWEYGDNYLKNLPANYSNSYEKTAKDLANEEDLSNLGKEEFEFTAKKASEVAMGVCERLLRINNIWGVDDSRQTYPKGFERPKEKSGYSQYEKINKNEEEGLYSRESGGPTLIGLIGYPNYEATSQPSSNRIRRSTAHEINHYLRALSNNFFWKGWEYKAQDNGLVKSWPDNETKQKEIGGYRVASSTQGSESLGNLFAAGVDLEFAVGHPVTIKEIIPEALRRLNESHEKLKTKLDNNDKITTSYYSSQLALVDHLIQLNRLGYGEIKVLDIISLTALGYISLEKAPHLIKAGILTSEKYNKMKSVIYKLSEWFTSKSEKGFKIQ